MYTLSTHCMKFKAVITTLAIIISSGLGLLGLVSTQALKLDSCSAHYSAQKMEEIHSSET
jgi:hypothetical protein